MAVQLHGMAERETCPNAFMSNGSSNVTTNSKRLLSCLTKSGVEARFERALYMFGRVRTMNPKTKWQLIDVPGVAHDQKGMALAAQKVLENRK